MIQEGYLKSFKCILSDFEKKSEQLLWSLGPVCAIGGLPYMTSEQKGGVKKYPKFVNKRYAFCGHRVGRGCKNPKILSTSYMDARHLQREK